MVDVSGNRSRREWSSQAIVGRVLWALTAPLFRLSPRPLWGWRRFLLRLFGAQIGKHVHIYPTVRVMIPWHIKIGVGSAVGDRVYLYSLGIITIGERATVSQNSHLCAGTHQWRDESMPLVKAPITIGDDAWICADAFIGPGVIVGNGAIVGARGAVFKNIEAGKIVGGNPATVIGERQAIQE